MAWSKVALAKVAHRNFHPENWSNFVGQSPVVKDRRFRIASGTSLAERAAGILGEELSLNNYLLTHSSIVASVDTYDVPNIKLGVFDGFMGRKVNRKWSNFRVTPETQKLINSNNDSWDRPVLLKSYQTFIGAQNFCFTPGTSVLMSDKSYSPIEQLEVGDRVISHEGKARKILHKFVREVDEVLLEVYVGDSPCPITVTGNHPFRVIAFKDSIGFPEPNSKADWSPPRALKAVWLPASELKPGMGLLGPVGVWLEDGEAGGQSWWMVDDVRIQTISKIQTTPYCGKVYNFEVEVDNSYVVDHGVAVHNCEHVQKEELSKGRIIDAVARDIGESVYIDILVATNRKHADLIRDIESGRMSTLSMGCFLAGTQVSMSDGTRVAIEDVIPGNMAMTHKGHAREIINKQIRVYRGETRTIRAGNISVCATANHGFRAIQAGSSVPEKFRADSLKPGDCLVSPGDAEQHIIESIESGWHDGLVYNMEVAEDHTYVVEGVAVHNCVVAETQCTKCGNVATDEVDLCDCQRLERGQFFTDENGVTHKIAELCGNKDMEHETCGVKFIEASWVGTPAFTGAVLRNIILPSELPEAKARSAAEVLASPPPAWTSGSKKRAFLKRAEFDFGGDSESEEAPAEEKEEKSPLDGLESEVEDFIVSRVKDRIHKKIQKNNQEEAVSTGEVEVSTNNNLLKEAAEYRTSVYTLMRVASSDAEFVNNLSLINDDFGIKVGTDLYRTALSVGPPTQFQTRTAYLTACQRTLGRILSKKEASNLLNLGQVLAKLHKERNF